MNKTKLLTKLSLLLLLTLLVAAVAIGCGEKTNEVTAEATVVTDAQPVQIGAGQYTFAFTATFADGSAKQYSVSTDCETVGAALLANGLIEGEDGPFGLYVKRVCGVLADYDVDQTYWALYADGESAMVGVDALGCADVKSVEFRVSK